MLNWSLLNWSSLLNTKEAKEIISEFRSSYRAQPELFTRDKTRLDQLEKDGQMPTIKTAFSALDLYTSCKEKASLLHAEGKISEHSINYLTVTCMSSFLFPGLNLKKYPFKDLEFESNLALREAGYGQKEAFKTCNSLNFDNCVMEKFCPISSKEVAACLQDNNGDTKACSEVLEKAYKCYAGMIIY